MKKGSSIKEQREREKAQRMSAYKQRDAERKEAVALSENEKKQATAQKASGEDNKAEKKSTAKAAGLKSTFVIKGDELLMTSFGKGNDAIIEKRIRNAVVEDVSENPILSVFPENERYFRIDGRVSGATTDNPLHSAGEEKEKTDLIHAKNALEKRFFGSNFEDNIHIQMIYSILDVEKIMAPHINNIVCQLNNMLRNKGSDNDDLIGYLSLEREKSFEKIKANGSAPVKEGEKLSAAQWKYMLVRRLARNGTMGYYNLEVLRDEREQEEWNRIQEERKQKCEVENREYKAPEEDRNTIKLSYEEFYQTLCLLGEIRQSLAHGNEPSFLYRIEDFDKKFPQSAKVTVQRLYHDRVQELNRKFLKMAKTDLILLFRAFGVQTLEEKKEYVQAYYDFIVRKQYKNLGFSIKKLRESMIEVIPEAMEAGDDKYSTVRNKLYRFLDFAISQHFIKKEEAQENLVGQLRASRTDEEKTEIYVKNAKELWPQIRELVIKHILPQMKVTEVAKVIEENKKGDKDVTEQMLEGRWISDSATFFTTIIYTLTLFLDGKEINDLITQLIHKFESISAFVEVMRYEGMPFSVSGKYDVFNQSREVAAELRVLNNIARMTRPAAHTKPVMFKDALKVLDMQMDNSEIDSYVSTLLDPVLSAAGSHNRGIRNFIANNVIESSRFHYIIRYGNVNKVKGLINNPRVVRFVLKDIPDNQIHRYYRTVTGQDVSFDNSMRRYLADRLTSFSFVELRDVRQSDSGASAADKAEKEQKRAMVSLYLTILYLIIKNLVYINSRYFLAFHCVERDRLLLDEEHWGKMGQANQDDPDYSYKAFARDQLAKYPQKPKVQRYMAQNFANSDDWAIRAYRNKIEHMVAVRNADRYLNDIREFHSWYELYHYTMQREIRAQYEWESARESSRTPGRMIVEKEDLNQKTFEYFDKVEKYGTCCRDFIKALNVPFAYNLPRYKNLSIDGLFDKNRPGKKGEGKKLELDEKTYEN